MPSPSSVDSVPGGDLLRARRLGHRVDRLPAQGSVQRYTVDTLTDELGKIKGSTDSAENLLNVNATAQTNLKAEEASGKKLTPYMTSLGFEVEFAQQSATVPNGANADEVVLKGGGGNLLDNAHIEVAKSDGLSMYTGIPFLLETDAGAALEFVTPPLLAPLEDSDTGRTDMIPDSTWEKAATRALEFGIKDRVEQPLILDTLVTRLNADWPVNLAFGNDGYKNHVFGPIRKEGKATHTNAQLNYMTTLRHYAEINMFGVGGMDPETQKVLAVLWGNGLSAEYDEGAEKEDFDALYAYAFVVSQKLREIPSAFNDNIFSIILEADTKLPQVGSVEEAITDWSKTEITAGKTHRWLLALEASQIKDKAQLWLKASYHQVLAAVPEKYRTSIVQVVAQQKDAILDLLVDARVFASVKSTLMRYYGDDKAEIRKELDKWFQQALANTDNADSDLDIKALEDELERPKEQKDRKHRSKIVGARADTYAGTDMTIGNEPLFLVETRMPTTYLELSKKDRYRYHKALQKVDQMQVEYADKQSVRSYFSLRDDKEIAQLKVQSLGKFDNMTTYLQKADEYLQLVTSKTKELGAVEAQVGVEIASVPAREAIIAYLREAVPVALAEGSLQGKGLLDQARQFYDEI